MTRTEQSAVPKACAFVGFAIMVILDLLRLAGCLIGRFVGGPKTPSFVMLELWVFVLLGIALILFFRWPVGVVIVATLNMLLIFTQTIPWGEPGLHGFFSQFSTDLILFITTILSFVSWRAVQRASNRHSAA